MSDAHPTEDHCAVYGCQNTRDGGRFVGDFCAPCDRAIRTGNFEFGTSVVFEHARVVDLTREYVREWDAGNSPLDAWGPLFRAVKALPEKVTS